MTFMRPVLFLLTASTMLFAAEPPASNLSKLLDGQIRQVESEIVSLAEAMPADKYDFAPAGGAFKGVRTFAQQMTHTAAVAYMVSAAALGEKNPSEAGSGENGPASIKGKDAVVKYLKDAFAYAHKAAGSITPANFMELVPSAFGSEKTPRLNMISVVTWHSFDHYGQVVVYARMNGIVPPASRQ
jgi:DinB family protein